jgi:hypothetical protein
MGKTCCWWYQSEVWKKGVKMKKKILLLLGLLMIVSVACSLTGTASPTPKTLPTSSASLPTVVIPTDTPASLPTVAVSPSPTVSASYPDYSSTAYLDDRSTPGSLVLSYANALSRHEYLRAYSYWSDPATYLGTLDGFSAMFTDVSSVAVNLGSITSEGAAGSIYMTVPAILTYSRSAGGSDRFSVCFLLRLPQPGNYGAPPITPMHIERGITATLPSGTSDTDGLASACSSPDYSTGGMPGSPATFASLADLSAANYIDNRSGTVEVISSLINAINRKEYVRAYSYWENPSVTPGDYNAYASGFNDTQSIIATFGTVKSDAGAGQWYYSIPVAEVVQTTSATTKTYVGCYTLHISNPGIQGTLPFRPLGIREGQFSLVANDADITSLLASACK